MNTCIHCLDTFDNWVLYQEHIAVGHIVFNEAGSLIEEREMRVFSSGRIDLGRREYPGPMNPEVKRLAVLEGQRRLGRHNFYGV